ncbi:polysaccharide pyruvyl transferase family protein [Eggerthella sinensis]|uniref:polysaccharide pyruvyl transferase family protein n=1 Tax=Eggerthella sinensis TaxID=242230 RepID=UPI0011CEBBEE|nr:polysaccharide pyruvyl transferase family protein [Eggerthella sinensis]MCB7039390.1 polysaccharide pyruvyl transferase family protein [Eggerthella sinensis]
MDFIFENRTYKRLSSSPVALKAKRVLLGNRRGLKGVRSNINRVNLEYSKSVNLGDSLSPVVVSWMLERKSIDASKAVTGTKHLMAIGSVAGRGIFDTTIWGSGVHKHEMIGHIKAQRGIRNCDIRTVRGPITREVFLSSGYECPLSYGDPAVLMPLIYPRQSREKRHKVSLVLHHANSTDSLYLPDNCNMLNIKTLDYAAFIDGILESELVISSSLHGIILAEAYGVPCVFMCLGKVIEDQLMKFEDWYQSTGRSDIVITHSLEEALKTTPMKLPDLDAMRKNLIESFPYDLWEA